MLTGGSAKLGFPQLLSSNSVILSTGLIKDGTVTTTSILEMCGTQRM